MPGHRCPSKTLQILFIPEGDEGGTKDDQEDEDHFHLDSVEVSAQSVVGERLGNYGQWDVEEKLWDLPESRVIVVGTKGEVHVNWKRLIMTFQNGDNRVMLCGEPGLPRTEASLCSLARGILVNDQGYFVALASLNGTKFLESRVNPALETLLTEFEDIFSMHAGLPPSREHEHAIVLKGALNPSKYDPIGTLNCKRMRSKNCLDRSMDSDKYLEGQSMQRPPLFESDSFIYWKNRFETYVKSKDLDLWHVITNGDFQPIIQNPETKLDEVVPFEKQTDDLKRKLAKNNEAKMVIYNALPRKEYERIFMCNTAKEIWKTLLITHQGNSQVKDNKIDLLVQQYEQFVISEDESIDSANF
ncbi:hypothetical protein Tco_0913396 [Tanacetum coccineum]